MNRKIEFDLDKFNHLYFKEKLSIRVVADKLGMFHTSLQYHCRKNKIRLRNKSEATEISYKQFRRNIKGVLNPNYIHGKDIDSGVGKRWNRYGITEDEFRNLLESQKNKCAICEKEFVGTPNIDHCHKTEVVRGLLCPNCNNGLGCFKDNPDLLIKALEYLKNG